MNNLFSKSSKRLLEKSSINDTTLVRQVGMLLTEQRQQRYDLKVINDKLDKLMVDKHLQSQVDDYFEDTPTEPPVERDLD